MMDVLGEIEQQDSGLTIRALTEALSLPRTTIYRILNTLHRHDMVWRDDGGAYHLGRRLLTLASHVAARASDIDLAAIGQPFLDQLASELGEGMKLSVIDQRRHSGARRLAGPARIRADGRARPAHADPCRRGEQAAARAPAAGRAGLLAVEAARRLHRKTITDPKRLRAELARIRRLGWARDRGEYAPSILAFAAPVFSKGGKMEAALSIPFLAGAEPSRMEDIRMAAIAAARAISEAMP